MAEERASREGGPGPDAWSPQHSKAGGGAEEGGLVGSETGLGRKTSASWEGYFRSQVSLARCPER